MCLERLFPLYTEIRFRVKVPQILIWFWAIMNFCESVACAANFERPSALSDPNAEKNGWMYIQSVCYCLTWVVGTDTYIVEAGYIILFLVVIVPLIMWFAARQIYKRNFIPLRYLQFIRIFQQFVVRAGSLPILFRFILCIEFAVKGEEENALVSCILWGICWLLLCVHVFLSSIFLEPFFVKYDSELDVYSGQSNIVLYVGQMIMAGTSMAFALLPTQAWQLVVSGIQIVIFFVLLYLRGGRKLHVTPAALFLELGPVIAFPAMTMCQAFNASRWLWIIVPIVTEILLVLVILWLEAYCVKMVKKFTRMRRVAPGSETKMYPCPSTPSLRILAVANGNPNLFGEFWKSYGPDAPDDLVKLDDGSKIEIVRHMGLFPSRREEVLNNLGKITPTSVHHKFMIHMFRQIIRPLTYGLSKPDKQKDMLLYDLQQIQYLYLYQQYLFWCARKERRPCTAAWRALSAVYYYMEYRALIKSAVERYPFNAKIQKILANFYLNACGKYNEAKEVELLISSLESSGPQPDQDPLLGLMAVRHPKIMVYCNKEERNIWKRKPRKTGEHSTDKQRPVASLITISKKYIPPAWMEAFIYLFVAMLFGFLFIKIMLTHEEIRVLSSKASGDLSVTASYVTTLMAITVSPHSFDRYNTPYNGSSEAECMKIFQELPYQAIKMFEQIDERVEYVTAIINASWGFYAEHIKKGDSICSIVQDFESGVVRNAENAGLKFSKMVKDAEYIIKNLDNVVSTGFYIGLFAWISGIGLIVIIVIGLIGIGFVVNSIHGKKEKAIDYLADIARFNHLRNGDNDIAWNLLRELETTDEQPTSLANNYRPRRSALDVSQSDDAESNTERRGARMDDDPPFQTDDDTTADGDIETILMRVSPSISELSKTVSEVSVPSGGSVASKTSSLYTLFTIYAPVICTFFAIMLMVYPLSTRVRSINGYKDVLIEDMMSLIAATDAVQLVITTVDVGGSFNSNFSQFDRIFMEAEDRIKHLYSKAEKRFPRNGGVIRTYRELMLEMVYYDVNKNETLHLLRMNLPGVARLAQDIISDIFVPDLISISSIRVSSGYSFCAFIVLLLALSLTLNIIGRKVLWAGFNSLFHFPENYLDTENGNEQQPAKRTMKSNVLVVCYVKDEIYSISENCKDILGRYGWEFINSKMSEIFSVVDDPSGNIRSYTYINGKVTIRKRFRIVTKDFGVLTKAVLVEHCHVKKDLSSSFQQCIPNAFVERFLSGSPNIADLENTVLIMCRLNNTLTCKASITTLMKKMIEYQKNYATVDLISMDGSALTFCTTKGTELVIGLLFVRDAIQNITVPNVKEPIMAFFVDVLDEDRLYVNTDGEEPYLDLGIQRLNQTHANVFAVPEKTVRVSQKLMNAHLLTPPESEPRDFYDFSYQQFCGSIIL